MPKPRAPRSKPLHPADIADLFELTPAEDRAALAAAIADLLDGDVLAEMNDWVREALIDALEPHQVADIAAELDTDDAVAIIEDMDADDQREVLRALDPDDRAAIEEALSYPEESAGRLMQRELIAVPEHWTVGDVLDYLRGNEDLTTDFWEIFVVDPAHKPVGTCQLSWILRTPRTVGIADVMKREQTLIPVDMDQEEVALRFQKYALISAAVVDLNGRLVGMITVDDVVHIISEEAGEDILRLSGAGDGDINEPVLTTVRTRLVWLVINLGTAMVAASVVNLFDRVIAGYALLAALMGIVSGMGGQCGDADAGGGGPRARDQPAHRIEHDPYDPARAADRDGQRAVARRADRAGRAGDLRLSDAVAGVRAGDPQQQRHRRAGRGDDPADDGPAADRSGGLVGGVRDADDRFARLRRVPRPRHAVPGPRLTLIAPRRAPHRR